MVDGLSQRQALLCHMQAVVLGFNVFKEHYMGDNKLQPILAASKATMQPILVSMRRKAFYSKESNFVFLIFY